LTTAERSQILQAAKSGKAQSEAGYVMAQPVSRRRSSSTIQRQTQNKLAKRPGPLAAPEKVTILKYITSTADTPQGLLKTLTMVNSNAVLTPAAPIFSSSSLNAGLIYREALEVNVLSNQADFNVGPDHGLTVYFVPASPGLYILNFSIKSEEPTQLVVKTAYSPDQTLNFGPNQDKLAVPVLVDDSGGFYEVSINSTESSWSFYSCEIMTAQ
jgi:hypothetical protein